MTCKRKVFVENLKWNDAKWDFLHVKRLLLLTYSLGFSNNANGNFRFEHRVKIRSIRADVHKIWESITGKLIDISVLKDKWLLKSN